MRLTRVKLAGFKSFVDPTNVPFPTNLTGVVGPNGCGKSNVIDAVRWVMGELSARHLRGDSMTDVIFNGSGGRRPVGAASVELVFDNSDGKIGGSYASYNEISLKRVVSRDGNSAYFINGARCRRKDITTLFLGTGLGSRSYAIIEQGMISRVIEARTEDMRAFVEEAAGISRYKERRRETEARVADTRENMERLQDLRDEVDKQIRHLTRQASQARRFQELKNDERRLSAEVLALRLREIDSGAAINDRAMRDADLGLQQHLAAQRAAEAAVEKQREFQFAASERVSQVQGSFYQQGAEVARAEQQLAHTRELRERQRRELAQLREMLAAVSGQLARDETRVEELRSEIAALDPGATAAQQAEGTARLLLEAAETELRNWQQRWEDFNREHGGTYQATQVERTRIEQLDEQLRRLGPHADRLAVEREQLLQGAAAASLQQLEARERAAQAADEALAGELQGCLAHLQELRARQHATESELEQARAERERARAEMVSLDALQKAALGEADRDAGKWLAAAGLAAQPRLTTRLEVERGWERGVEAVLGDVLEAVQVDSLEAAAGRLAELTSGHVMLVEGAADAAAGAPGLGAHVRRGSQLVLRRLARVGPAASLAEALRERHRLPDGHSFVTPEGVWIGRDWLRVARGRNAQAGVLERERRIRDLRGACDSCDAAVTGLELRLREVRAEVAAAEGERDNLQVRIQAAHREYSEARGQLEATRARSQQAALRLERIEHEARELAAERERTQQALARSRAALDAASQRLDSLESRRGELEEEREARRAAAEAAREQAQQTQGRARELLIQLEGRRSSENSLAATLNRMLEQRAQLGARQAELENELGDGDGPILRLTEALNALLARKLEIENDLQAARRDLETVDAGLRELDEKRLLAERAVGAAREALEKARLAAQETRLRRESVVEQFVQTRFELAEVQGQLPAGATILEREDQLAGVQAELGKLGAVNLAAIDELKEQNERKSFLDAQWQDLTEALDALEEAMRKIDRETRTRFESTFERINDGLKEKFPRLFGGGHAYLELVGDDVLTAGVAVMARPPGKRNSTISQLSGGEKALTAVALVFSIFDLNPAPFCLLDEVDAPLDEHNVSRFCDIVREMSGRVQFIFITHNKTTMELAEQLVGVTMNEPGVSRLVSVDVDEAVRLAAV
ncbi:MAG TPA: chromosome segregation protein SMC [Steroidobacteraceae bacterium]|nr:chromosome segregation protein SMC [Steroidobacteraceae bacterium]